MTGSATLRALVTALFVAVPAEAQSLSGGVADWLRPRATLRSGGWSATRNADGHGPVAGLVAWADIASRRLGVMSLRGAGWAGAGRVAGRDPVGARLRELYADLDAYPLGLRAGKQILAWGRADAVNPTDNLTSRDLTLLVADDADQKTGVPAVRATLTTAGPAVSALWLAGFTPDRLPGGALPPGASQRLPSAADSRRQVALRVDQSGGRVDWSVSWFSGFDLMPDATVVTAGGVPRLELRYHRIHVLGADAATVLGRYGLRAEAAWTRTGDETGRDPEVKNGTVYAVLGADRTFGPSFNVNLQYVVRVVTGFTPADAVGDPARRQAAQALMAVSGQLRRVQQGFTLRLSDQWLHETLKAEISTVAFAAPRQYLVRLRARYAMSDRWELVVGADRMEGEAGTLFHMLRRNSLVFTELRRGL